MVYEKLNTVTRFGDTSIEACAHRLHMTLLVLNISQSELAHTVGFQNSSITNMIKARQFPSRDIMLHLYFTYGVDLNFMNIGEVANLPKKFVDGLVELARDEVA